MSFKSRLYNIVDEDSRVGNVFNTLVILLIILNMLAIILESVKSLHGEYHFWFNAFESFCLVVFTFEYISRLLTADIKLPHLKGWRPFVKYMFSFMAMVDLMAILPSLLLIILPQGMLADLAFIRMLRIMRVFRVLKITRYSGSLKMMGDVLKAKLSDISVTIFIAFILMIIASTLMYYAEHDAQPDQFPDIVHAFWWAVATLTTVGYGDVYPVTALGKILSGVIAILGIGLVALPTGILSSAFVDKMEEKKGRAAAAKKEGQNETEANAGSSSEGKAEAVLAENAGKNPAFPGPLPACPHDSLRKAGEFPGWMKFCPMCGEEMGIPTPK